ncbi:MAG TPA: inositol monophosphatase family protein [Anaerolineales bacterium]|nr:inositol monophosphatase family protein [Anaerolineales bacterium]
MSPPSLQDRYERAVELARQAGALLRAGLGSVETIEHKGAIDLLTEYDLRSERLLVDGLRQSFPDDPILAEEGGGAQGARRWLIDPLDGTTNFAHGLPHFSVSLAYAEGGDIRLGVVFDPARSELFHAIQGGGAFLNQARLRVSSTASLDRALLVTGFPYDIRTADETNLELFSKMALRAQGLRRLGSAALDLAYVAAGRFDGYWELRLSPWDWAAGILLVREAGGRVTRLSGEEDIFRPPTSIIASNRLIHQAMLEALEE